MPGANPPRVPEGLRDMMKSLTKEVLREKPSNILEFSAHYFETMLHDGRDSPVRNYEPQESYDTIMKNRVKHQVPLSLVYSVVPESLTDLIKEFIKAVLRQKPKNICEFAVEYFRQQQIMKEMQSTTSVDYTSYENYFQKKDRYSYTSYVKCSCGRLLGNAAYESNYLNIKKTKQLRQSSKTSKSSVDDTSSMCKIEHEEPEEMSKTAVVAKTENDRGIKYIKAVYVIQRHFRLYLTRKRKTKAIIGTKVMVPSSSSSLQEAKQPKQRENLSMETAALVLQKAYRKFLKNNRLRKQNTLQEAALKSNKISPQTNMSMETAALIIQKAFHKFSNKRLHNNKLSKTTKMSKLETTNTEGEGDESNDNMSETASYTSASTALLSTESVGEHFDLSGANEEGVLHQTIQEDEEVENDNQNTITLSNKGKVGKISDMKGSDDIRKLSANNEKDIELKTSETENFGRFNQPEGKNIDVIKIVNDSLRTIIDGIELDTSHKDFSENDKNSSLTAKNTNLITNINDDDIRKKDSASDNSENLGENIQETTKEIKEEIADAMKSEALNKTHSDLSNSLDDLGKSIKIKSVIEGKKDYEIIIDNSENNIIEPIGISSTKDSNENQGNENTINHSIDLEAVPETERSDSKVNNKSSNDLETVDPIMSDDKLQPLPEKMISSETSVEESQNNKAMNSTSFSQQDSVEKFKSDTKNGEKEEISKDTQKESVQPMLNNKNEQLSDGFELKSLDKEKDDIKDNRNEDILKEEFTRGNDTSELITNNQMLKETTQMFINVEQNNEVLKDNTKPVEDSGTSEIKKYNNTILHSSDHDNEATSNTFEQSKDEALQESELEVVDSQNLESIDKRIVSEPQITDSTVAGNKEKEDMNEIKEEHLQDVSTSDKNLSEQKSKTTSKNSENLESHVDKSEQDKSISAKTISKVVDFQKEESIDKQIVSESQKSDDTVAGNKEIEDMNKLEEEPLQEVSTTEQNLSEPKIKTVLESSENLQPNDDKTKLQDLSTTTSDKTVDEQILKRERRALNETKSNISDSGEGSSKLNLPDNDDSEIKVELENKRKDSSETTSSLNKSENDVSKITDESDDKGKDSSLGKTSSLNTPYNDDSKTTVESFDIVKSTNVTSDPEIISSDQSKAEGTISTEESLTNTNLNEQNHTSQEKSKNDEYTNVASDTEPHSLENFNKLKANTKDNSVDSNVKKEPSSQIEDNNEEILKEDSAHKTNLTDSNVKDQNKEEASISSQPIIDGSENTKSTNVELRDISKVNSQDSKDKAISVEKPEITEKASLKTASSDTEILTPKSSVDDTQNLSSYRSDTKSIENVLEHSKQESFSKGENSQPSNESLLESLSLNSQDNLDDKILTEELMQETESVTTDKQRKSSSKSSQELNSIQPSVEVLDSVQTNKSLENTVSKEDDKKEDTILSKQILEKEEGLSPSGTTSNITKQLDEVIPHTDQTHEGSVLKPPEIDSTNADKKSHDDMETSKEKPVQKIDSSDSDLNEENVGVRPENSESLVDHIQIETLSEVKDDKGLVSVHNLESNNKSSEFNKQKQDLTETVLNEQTVNTQKSENDPQDEIFNNTKLTEDEDDKNLKESKGNDTQENTTSSLTRQKSTQSDTFVQSTELETISEPTLSNEDNNENQDIIVDQQSAQGSVNSKEFVEDPLNGEQPNVKQSLNKSNSENIENRNEANSKSSQDDESTESNERSEPPRSASIKTTEEKSELNKSTELEIQSDKNKDKDDMRSKENESQISGSGEHEASAVVTKSISVDNVDRTEDMNSKQDNSQKSGSGEHEVAPKSNPVDVVERSETMSSKEDNSHISESGEHEISTVTSKSNSVDDNERIQNMSSKEDNSQKFGSAEREVGTKSNSVDDVEGTDINGSRKNRPGIGPSGKIKDKNFRGYKQKVDDLSSSQIDENKTIGTSKLSESSNNKLTHASLLPNSKKLHSSNQKDKRVDYSSGRLIPVPIAELQLKSFKTPENAGPWYEVHVEKPNEEEKDSNVKSEEYQNTKQSIYEQQREEEKNSNTLNEEYQNDEDSIFESIDIRSETSSYESNKSTLELLYHLNNELRYNSEISEIERLISLMHAADQDVSYLKDPLDYTNFSEEEERNLKDPLDYTNFPKEEERIPKYLHGTQSQERTPPTNNKSSISFFVPFDKQDNQSAKSKKHPKQNLQKLDIKGNNEIRSTSSKEILSQSMIEDSLDEIMEMEDIIINETMPSKSLLQTIPEQNENESPSPHYLDSKSILVINESETSENNLECSFKPKESIFAPNALDTSHEDGSILPKNNSQNLASEPNSSTQNPSTLVDDTENTKPNEIIDNDAIKEDIKIDSESDKETHDIATESTIEAKPTDLDSTNGPRSADSISDKDAGKHVGMYEKVHHEIARIVQNFNSASAGANKSDHSMEETENVEPGNLQDTRNPQSENANSEKVDKNDELNESSEKDGVSDENEPQEGTSPDITSSEDGKKDGGVLEKVHHEIAKIVQNSSSSLEGADKSDLSMEETENVEPANLQDTRNPQSENANSAKVDENNELKQSSEKDGVSDENELQDTTSLDVTSSEDGKKDGGVNEKEFQEIDTSEISGQDLKAVLPDSIISEASMEDIKEDMSEDKISEKVGENKKKESEELYGKMQEKDTHEITTSAFNEQNLKQALSGSIKSELSIEQPANVKPVDLDITRQPRSVDQMSVNYDETEYLKEGGEKDNEIHETVTSEINERNLNSSMTGVSNSKHSIDQTEHVKTGDLEDTHVSQSENKMNEKDNDSKEFQDDEPHKEDVHEIVSSELNVLNLNSALPKATNAGSWIDETENVKPPDLESIRIPRSVDKLSAKVDDNEEFKEGGEINDKSLEKEPDQLASESSMDQAQNSKGPEEKINEENNVNENATLIEVSEKGDKIDEEEPPISDLLMEELENVKETDLMDILGVNKMSENTDENEEFNDDDKKDINMQKEEPQEIATSELNLALPNDTISEHSMEEIENIKLAHLEDALGSHSENKVNEKENENKEFMEEGDLYKEVPHEIVTSELINKNVKEDSPHTTTNDKLSMEQTDGPSDLEEPQSVNELNEKENKIEEFLEGGERNDKIPEKESNEIATSDFNEQNLNSTLSEANNSKLSMDEPKNTETTDLEDTRVSQSVDKMGTIGVENEDFKEGGEIDGEIYEKESNEIASEDINKQNLKSSLLGANIAELSMDEPKNIRPTDEKADEIFEKKSNETATSDMNEKNLKSSVPGVDNSVHSMQAPKNVKPTDLQFTGGPQLEDKMSEKGEENEEFKEGGESAGEIYDKDSNEISSTDISEQNLKSSLPGANNSELSLEEAKNVTPTDLEHIYRSPSGDKVSEKGEENEEFKEGGELKKEALKKETHETVRYVQNVNAGKSEDTNSIERIENANSVDLKNIRRPQSVDKNEADKIGNENTIFNNASEQDDKMITNEPELKKLRSTNSDSLIEEINIVKSTDLVATHKINIDNTDNENIASNEVNERNERMSEEETFEFTTSELDEQNLNAARPGNTNSKSLMEDPENAKLTDMESKSTHVTSSVDKLNVEIDENGLAKKESLNSKNTELETRSKEESSEEDNLNQQIDDSNIKDENNESEVENELSGKTKLDSESYESNNETDDTATNNVPLNIKIAQENEVQNHDETKLMEKVGKMSDMAKHIAAAIVIQRAFRGFLKHKNNKNAIENSKKLKEIAENEAASVIQKAFRQYIFNISHKKQAETNLESSDMESFENTKENDNKSENSSVETSPSVSQITQIYNMNRTESQISTDTIENLSNLDYLDGSDNKMDSPKSKWFVGNEPIESTKDAPNLISVDSRSLSIIDTNSSDSEKLLVIADTEPQLVACLNNVDDSNLKSNLSIGNNIIGEENGESVEGTNENSKNNDLAGLREDETQTSESGNKEDDNTMIQNDEPINIKFETKIDEPDTAFNENINEEMLVEVIEKPCIKKTVSQSNLNEIESAGNKVTESNKDLIKTAESPESEAETDVILKTIETDSLDAATEKLSKADEVIEKMFSRRLSETKSTPSLSEMTFKEPSFDEPVIRPMSALHENISIDLEETDVVVLNRLQREDTRESSAQSDAIVFGENNLEKDDLDALENIEISTTRMKRLYTIAGDDTSIMFKSVTIDETVKYIDPPNSSTSATSGSSFCLDDDISENIRQKMMAYSLSEADSDYFESNNDGPDTSVDRSAVRNDDFNISTALADTTGTSTETESTIVSAATKIQAGARGFLTRRRLRRLSGGTTASNLETKASFGNAAISESLERFIEDEAAKKIQIAYRNHYYKKGKVNEQHDDVDVDDEGTSLDNSLAARRLTLQRGDALRNDSTPDEDHNDNGNNTGNITKLNNSSSTVRSKPLGDYRLKPWAAMRQNSMPVQIDTNIFRVIPKQLSKRIKSAENEKKTRRITSFRKK